MWTRSVLLLTFAVQTFGQFLFPEVTLQALPTGFTAFIPDVCGIDKLKFEWQAKGGDWLGGYIPPPIGGVWTYHQNLPITPGDIIKYRASLLYNGVPVLKPEAIWNVSAFVDEFVPPPPGIPCPPVPSKLVEAVANSTEPPPPSLVDIIQRPIAGICSSPWLLSAPGDDRSTTLEKQVVRLQCELSSFTQKYALLANAMDSELTDLKKLNYAMVARMQKLETILRAAPPPFPFP